MIVILNKFVSLLLLLILNDILKVDGSSNLTPFGEVHYCPGEPLVFTCRVARVSDQPSTESLRWRIHFRESLSIPDVTWSYLATDAEGRTHMSSSDEHNFLFNLTVNNQLELVSTLTATVGYDGASTIDNATVLCGEDPHQNLDQNALVSTQGVPAPPIIVTETFEHNEEKNGSFTLVLMWISSEAKMVDDCIVLVSSTGLVMTTFTTNDTAVHIPLFYNEEYNISVMANNCAGNSTAAEMNVRIGFCDPPDVVSPNVTIRGKSSGVEGTQITCYCQQSGEGQIQTEVSEMVSTCMSDGSWSPDPHDLECLPSNDTVTVYSLSGTPTEHEMLVISITTTLLVVITLTSIAIIVLISLIVFHRKVQKGSSNIMAEDGVPSLHNDNNQTFTASSTDNEGNYTQEIGMYSLLQSEEPAYSSRNLGDSKKKQDGELVYADIGHSIHLTSRVSTTHPNLSLQLDDDHVQYAGIDHQLTASELDTTLENTDTRSTNDILSDESLDLDTVLIQIRSHVTSKWQQFGVAVGLSKAQLEKYTGYPEEECIVEVVDYWQRNHPLTITKPTWMDVAKALREIELHHLADIILSKYKAGQVNNVLISEADDVPPPVPSKMFDLDEDMTQLPLPTPALTQSECDIEVGVSHKGSSPPPLPPPYTETRLSTIAPPVPPKNNLQN